MVRNVDKDMQKMFDSYYKQLIKILNIKPRMVPETAVCSTKLLKAQEMLEKRDAAAAQEVLEEIKDVFKKHEETSQ